MFESIDYPYKHNPELDENARHRFQELREAITGRSQIIWGEHCSECAAPTCYAACSFYTPRHEDLNCGRFAKGIRKGNIPGGVRLATIRFRKWGKLQGKGPVGLKSPRYAERREKLDDVVSDAISRWIPSVAVRRFKRGWNKHKIDSSSHPTFRADAFVIEGWLPDAHGSLSLTLTVMPANETGDGLFQDNIDFGPGYNRKIVPVADITRWVDLLQPYVIKIEPLENAIGKDITFGMMEFVTFGNRVDEVPSSRPAAAQGGAAKAKCVVWDLDNTVWRGTLAEDGPEGLVLDERVPGIIHELDRRGILQSVASKNDMEPALSALEAFGLTEYFLYPQIGWDPKSTGIRRIAELLDIGLDTFVFIDDQPFERAEVHERLPSVAVLSEADLPTLLENTLFDVPVTAESISRRSMYQAEQQRKSTFQSSSIDYVEFLRGCDLVVEASVLSDTVMERAHELSQRTNQLNVSGRRYTRDELEAYQASDDSLVGYIFSCRDRFGNYGIIAMCLLDEDKAHIESFMMSCRVQRKRVEQAIFSWLARRLAGAGFDYMSVQYKQTSRNEASVRMLEELGFDFRPNGPQDGVFVRSTHDPIPESDVVKVLDRIDICDSGAVC